MTTMNKFVGYALIYIFLLTLVFWGFNIYFFENLKPKNPKMLKMNFGKLYYPYKVLSEDSIKVLARYIENSIELTDKTLEFEKISDLNIMYTLGEKKISKAYPKQKVITFYHFNFVYPPYIHEYIHTQLGLLNEYWLTEGSATFLSLKVKDENPQLKKLYDINDNWFGKSYNNKFLCNIENLKQKYTADEIRAILILDEKKPKFKNLNEQVVYYRLSASFCEYLFTKIGFHKFLQLLKINPNLSIESKLKKQEFNLKSIFNNWISENFK